MAGQWEAIPTRYDLNDGESHCIAKTTTGERFMAKLERNSSYGLTVTITRLRGSFVTDQQTYQLSQVGLRTYVTETIAVCGAGTTLPGYILVWRFINK